MIFVSPSFFKRRLVEKNSAIRCKASPSCYLFLFIKWILLTGLALNPMVTWATTTAVLSFYPPVISRGNSSTLRISFLNIGAATVTITSGNSLTLPSGLTYNSAPVSSCTGLVPGVNVSNTVLSFTGAGTLAPDTQCEISVSVTSNVIANYPVPFAAGFFTTTDGSNPPEISTAPTLTVKDFAPVSITLIPTRADSASTTGFIINSVSSNSLLDFTDPGQIGRYRYIFNNPNALPLTGVSLTWPAFTTPDQSVIPNSFLPGSLVTDGSAGGGLTPGMVGCGGSLTLNSSGQPVLTGATIPANGQCEVSYLVRYDANFGGGVRGSFPAAYIINAGLLNSAQGVTNIAFNTTLSRSNGSQTFTRPATINSGFIGDTFNMNLSVLNDFTVTAVTTSTGGTPGLIWTVGAGIDPVIPVGGVSSAAGCPVMTPGDWDSLGRTLTLHGTIPPRSCVYSVPFVATYPGPGYVDVAILPLGAQIFTTPGGINSQSLNVRNETFRAVGGTSTPGRAVTIGARLLDANGAVTTQIPRSSLAMLELTLNAPIGVSNYQLVATHDFLNASDTHLSYVPAPTSDCGATIAAANGGSSFSLGSINLPANGTCIVRLPVVGGNLDRQFLRVDAGDAFGTVAGDIEFSPVLAVSFVRRDGVINTPQQFIPATLPLTHPNTVYTYTINKLDGSAPVEDMRVDIPFTTASGFHLGLRPTHILSDTCKASINGVAPGNSASDYPLALPGGVTTLNIRNASTPDAAVRGTSVYDNSAGFDASAFAASSCQIQVQVVPDPALLATIPNQQISVFDQITGAPNIVFTDFGGIVNLPLREIGTPVAIYTIVTGPVSPVTLGKIFTPNLLEAGATSRMRITLSNNVGAVVDLTEAALTDDYILHADGGLINSSAPDPQLITVSGNPCSGKVSALPGGTAVSLSEASIPAGSVCAIEVNVLVNSAAGATNILPYNVFSSLQISGSANTPSAAIGLTASFGVVSRFDPSILNYHPLTLTSNVSTLEMSLINTFTDSASLDSPYNHTVPAGLLINGNITVTGDGCSGSLNTSGWSIGGTNFTLSGSIPARGTCNINIPVRVVAPPLSPATSQLYTDTVNANTINITAGVTSTSNISPANASLEVFAPATITINKVVSGNLTGRPPGASYGVELRCDMTGLFPLTVSESVPASQMVLANDLCEVTEITKPSPLPGYGWSKAKISPDGKFTTLAGDEHSVSIENVLLSLDDEQLVTATAVFSPPVSGGMPGVVNLLCEPNATPVSGMSWFVAVGADCELQMATAPTAPAGYTLGATTFGTTGATLVGSNTFVMPNAVVTAKATTVLSGPPQPLIQSVPTLNQWMLLLLGVLLASIVWRQSHQMNG